MRLIVIRFIFIFLFAINSFLNSQELQYSLKSNESSKRQIISLNKNWIFKDKKETRNFSVPFFIDDDKISLENKFQISELPKYLNFILNFEGIRGLEEIYINDQRIPFDAIDLERFSFQIASNIIQENSNNTIRLIISKKSKIKEQNALSSKLLLAERKPGIFKDVYLEIIPQYAIFDFALNSHLSDNLQLGKLNYEMEIHSSNFTGNDSIAQLTLVTEILNDQKNTVVSSKSEEITLAKHSMSLERTIEVNNPILWEPDRPIIYYVRFRLFSKNDLVDEITSNIAFRKIEIKDSKLFLNNKPFTLRGVTYFESNGIKGSFFNLKDYRRDLKLIKDLGVNAIYVKNSFPSRELMMECELNGILVFLDLESKIYPQDIYNELQNFLDKKLIVASKTYSNFACFAGMNLGTINSSKVPDFLNDLASRINTSQINILKFVETAQETVTGFKEIDFLAFNLLGSSVEKIEKFLRQRDKNEFYVISSIGYNHGLDEEEGYSNPYSVQAQAKYLSDVLRILLKKDISFFVHTFSDYRLPYHSIYAGKIDNKLLKFGLVNEYRDKKKLSYQTVRSYLKEEKLPVIMRGEYEDEANVIFVFSGLLFLAFTILTINSTHRFRETVSRAILKTFNFYSDIRDGWFISSFHSFILAIVISLSIALNYSALFFYWKDRIEFEKFFSLFNSQALFEFISFISWRPIHSILISSVLLFLLMMFFSLIIRVSNIFARNKIFINHAFLIVIWGAVPFLLLIPLGMINYKLLLFGKYNFIIYIVLLIFHLWIFMRILKGISIVFEVRKSKVYSITLGLIIIILVSLIVYLQVNFSSIDYFMEFFG